MQQFHAPGRETQSHVPPFHAVNMAHDQGFQERQDAEGLEEGQEYEEEYEEYDDEDDEDIPNIILNTERVPADQPSYPRTRPAPGTGVGRVNMTWSKTDPTKNTTQPRLHSRRGPTVHPYEIEIDSLEDKPWRKPTEDITDYFNYGFNEETWKQYCKKQMSLRLERGVSGGKISVWEGQAHSQNNDELPAELLAIAPSETLNPSHEPRTLSRSYGNNSHRPFEGRHRRREHDESVIKVLGEDEETKGEGFYKGFPGPFAGSAPPFPQSFPIYSPSYGFGERDGLRDRDEGSPEQGLSPPSELSPPLYRDVKEEPTWGRRDKERRDHRESSYIREPRRRSRDTTREKRRRHSGRSEHRDRDDKDKDDKEKETRKSRKRTRDPRSHDEERKRRR